MKKIAAMFVFFTTGICLYAQALAWDVKFLKGRAQESLPISRQIRMETGDFFLITVKPEADCFCYVVFYDSSREITVLKDAPLMGGVEMNIGPFELEEPAGIETFYVIMSLERQKNLESFIQTFNNNSSRQNANNLYNEVVNLQKTVSSLGEPASSFIASGGTTRAGPSEQAQQTQVTRFSGKAMYVRAITIRH
jgi:hypothetical protein